MSSMANTYGSEEALVRDRNSSRIRSLLGTPSRFMKPRLILYLATFALVALGLLMIYSSSSIVAMTSEDTGYNAAYYLQRQLIFGAVGLVAAAIVAVSDYHLWAGLILPGIWVGTVVLLVLVLVSSLGRGAYGATRWININGFTLQPAEFAKVTVILTAANIMAHRYEGYTFDDDTFWKMLAVGVALPIGLIFAQPDKGSAIVCGATLLVMAYLAGVPSRYLKIVVGIAGVGVLIVALKDDYSRQRILTVFNPWKDEFGAGYQLIQGFYAFGSGGLFGVGIGMSRQKYSYLPMAHNDFIFAVIGEELGLMGTLGTLFGFAAVVWAGLQIARYAPDLMGRLVAAGCTTMILIQLFVNICGVLGIIPLSGKPIPFLSYGGSSIISSLLLVGFIASVSRHSRLPETVFDERRRDWTVSSARDEGPDTQLSLVGEATPRSARTSSAAASGFSLVSGTSRATRTSSRSARSSRSTRSNSPEALRAEREAAESVGSGRVSVDSKGRRRIDLGPSASERLRSSRGGRNGRR